MISDQNIDYIIMLLGVVVMKRRMLNIDWCAINGASRKKRILHFNEDSSGVFICPVSTCLHSGFKSKRGIRKHISSIHNWYYYFNEQPVINRAEIKENRNKSKCSTLKMPAFSLTEGIGKEFLDWLLTPCGGGKSNKEALQTGRRAMKFLKASMGEQQEEKVSERYADCCLGSPSVIMSFLQDITERWEISSSGAFNYMKAIGDLMDYRKSCGVSDEVLRSFAVTEVYVRRGKENLSKRKRLEYARNLKLETLVAKNSWASIEEMEKVVPYHTPMYQSILDLCKGGSNVPNVTQLAFATRFIVTFLFLRVKCTRPMSFRYLTMEMVDEAKRNGGFVDQTSFKTCDKYVFDTLLLIPAVLDVLETYKRCIRPLCNPCCDYFIVTTNGTQYTAFSTAMSLLVYEAIGKYVHPTRYRQIIETESNERLNEKEREIISKDQKHSSYVAKRAYQKKLCREVALDARSCMEKLVGTNRDEHTLLLASTVSGKDIGKELPNCVGVNETIGSFREVMINESTSEDTVIEIDEDKQDNKVTKLNESGPSDQLQNKDVIVVKKEEAEEQVKSTLGSQRFTEAEDHFLRLGVKKYGYSNWSKILKDKDYEFNPSRTRDSLRIRARTLKLKKKEKSRLLGSI